MHSDMMGHAGMMTGGMWWMLLWFVLAVVIIAAVVVGAILLVRSLWTRAEPFGATIDSSALSILMERYARGEIDRDEYEERRGTLTGAG